MRWGKFQQFILLAGDVILLYSSLYFVLFLRYSQRDFDAMWQLHFIPFSIVFFLWIMIFYIVGLYEGVNVRGKIETTLELLKSLAIGGLIAIALFYLVPSFLITPRTNLLIDLTLAFLVLSLWRMVFQNIVHHSSKLRVLVLGSSPDITELISFINQNPQFGYEIRKHQNTFNHDLPLIIENNKVSVVVASKEHQSNKAFVRMLYDILPNGVSFIDSASFYEKLLGKIPVSLISEVWFLENLAEAEKKPFEIAKRLLDIALSIVVGIWFVICFLPLALLIKVDSRGRIFYHQRRVGKDKKEFTIIKFRTMVENAENGRARWAGENDKRITFVGKFLRKSRLDELPQLWNVLKGEMSFIGPRPERPEFVEELRTRIPFYDMRHLVRPGLSGWAQIRFPYGASHNDALEKLQYDLFYIKNRSIGLDIAIVLKTIAKVLSNAGR